MAPFHATLNESMTCQSQILHKINVLIHLCKWMHTFSQICLNIWNVRKPSADHHLTISGREPIIDEIYDNAVLQQSKFCHPQNLNTPHTFDPLYIIVILHTMNDIHYFWDRPIPNLTAVMAYIRVFVKCISLAECVTLYLV